MKWILSSIIRKYQDMKMERKFLTGYFFIVLAPVILLTFFLAFDNYRSIKETQMDTMRESLSGYADYLDRSLEQISSYRYFFQDNAEISSYLNNEYETTSDILYYWLSAMKDSFESFNYDERVQSITLYGLSDYRLTIKGSLERLADFPDLESLFEIIRKEYNGIWSLDASGSLRYDRPFYHRRYNTLLGFLEITTDLSAIVSLDTQRQESGALYLYDRASETCFLCSSEEIQPLAEPPQGELLSTALQNLDCDLCMVCPEQPFPLNYLLLYLFVGGISLLFFSLIYFFMCRSITGRLIAFEQFVSGQNAKKLQLYAKTGYKDEVGSLILAYNQLVSRINELIYNNYEVSLKLKDARYYALQAQIKPHFFYNILENIHMSSEQHNDGTTAHMTQVFGAYMRYVMNDSTRAAPLENELKSARDFLEVNKIRLPRQLSYEISTETELDGFFCPRFIFQTILENSIKHGIKGEKPLHIRISVKSFRPGEYSRPVPAILIRIEDNGSGIEPKRLAAIQEVLYSDVVRPSTRHVGLRNINDRLKAFNGDNSGLTVESPGQKGTIVCFSLIRKEKNNFPNLP